jgi:hypothetical protein
MICILVLFYGSWQYKNRDNHVYDNIHYGLDRHTGTHGMTIRNNTVHDNGSIGIICSLDCYNLPIENDVVYNNTKIGIMFSRNMTDSIVRNLVLATKTEELLFLNLATMKYTITEFQIVVALLIWMKILSIILFIIILL